MKVITGYNHYTVIILFQLCILSLTYDSMQCHDTLITEYETQHGVIYFVLQCHDVVWQCHDSYS